MASPWPVVLKCHWTLPKYVLKLLKVTDLLLFLRVVSILKLLFNYQKWIFLIENKIKKNVSLGHWIKKFVLIIFVLIIFVLVGRALLLWLVEWNLTYQNQPEWFFLDDIHIASDWWHFSAITPTPHLLHENSKLWKWKHNLW